jgi:putative aldouronate transport system permease protein
MVRGRRDIIFDWTINIFLIIIGLCSVIPLMYVFSSSLTPFGEVLRRGGFILVPHKITFTAYEQLFRQKAVFQSFFVTVRITLIGTTLNMNLTTLLAYPLSRKSLPGRRFFHVYIIFTMLFTGGIIPTYLVVRQLGLLNTLWALILPQAVWTFNTLVMKSYFESVPEELFESARIEGAGEFRILIFIMIPLAIPTMMTVMLFYLVMHWNQFFQAILYITKQSLQPLQVIVRQLLTMTNAMDNPDLTIPTVTLQNAIVVFASIPVIAVYPFIQRYFTKGMMLGAIKG